MSGNPNANLVFYQKAGGRYYHVLSLCRASTLIEGCSRLKSNYRDFNLHHHRIVFRAALKRLWLVAMCMYLGVPYQKDENGAILL